METLIALVVLVLIILPLGVAISRSTELFVLRVDRGRVLVIRGRLPGTLLRDLQDIFEHSQETGRVCVTVERRIAEIRVYGEISTTTHQQLRNVIGNVPIQRIRSGRSKH